MSGPGSDSPSDETAQDGDGPPPSDVPTDGDGTGDLPRDGTETSPTDARSTRGESQSDSNPTDSQTHSHTTDEDGPSLGEDTREPTPEPRARKENAVTIEDDGVIRWFFKTDNGTVVAIRDVLSSVAIVGLVGLILFGISGVWPPLVAVESASMEPNMERGDLIFVVDENRFSGDGSISDTGVVTHDVGANGDYDKFGEPGDVIIFLNDGNPADTPIIHRAEFWVEEGENWVDEQADSDYLNGNSCNNLRTCPANHDGFVTKGDNNNGYDQAGGGANTDVVKPAWINGKGMFRIPWLGHVRLTFDELLMTGPSSGVVSATSGAPSGISNVPTPLANAGIVGLAGLSAGSAALIKRRRSNT